MSTLKTNEISNTDDVIDVRDIIARVEELEEMLESTEESEGTDQENRDELAMLVGLLDELKGNGGDEKWKGDWYPITLIRDSYFTDAMQELVQDIGGLPREIPSYLEIDWERTADNLRVDYSQVEFDEVTYWYR